MGNWIGVFMDPKRKKILIRLAEEYGTPLYVYFLDTIKERIGNLISIIENYLGNYLIAYACKACSLLYVCSHISKIGLGAEVVSDGELYIALKAGFDRDKIIFDGVSKGDYEIEYALSRKIYSINCESLKELEVISDVAKKLGVDADIGLRINPKVSFHTHSYLETGTEYNKFGIDFEEVSKNLDLIKKLENVNLRGFHFHLGSNIYSAKPFIDAINRISSLISLAIDKGYEIEYLDIGGGIPSIKDKQALKDYLSPILEALNEKVLNLGDIKIIFEPGRYIVADSAVLLTRVNYVKRVGKNDWVLVDAGMNDFIRPALYNAIHPIEYVSCISSEERIYSIGGPVCESSDVFAKNIRLPVIKRGDLLAILEAGAYGISISSNYNSRRRPAVVAVEGDKYKLIRMREEFRDLIDKEIV